MSTPAQKPAALGPQDDHPILGDAAGGEHGVGQREPAGHVEGVDRRVVDDHLGDSRLALVGLDGHGCSGRSTTGRVAGARHLLEGRLNGLVERA